MPTGRDGPVPDVSDGVAGGSVGDVEAGADSMGLVMSGGGGGGQRHRDTSDGSRGVREGAEKDETVRQLAKPPTPQFEEPVAEHTLKPPGAIQTDVKSSTPVRPDPSIPQDWVASRTTLKIATYNVNGIGVHAGFHLGELLSGAHGYASLHELECKRHGLADSAFVLDAFLVREVERKVHLMADVARREAVERHAGDVGEKLRA